ncbi:MAG: hypothetical protein SAJ12_23970 [Jaaginema sp. PMC 1079.18]|nr:hypothetical protein [Jaaginema sp. PMC 1080.18]MEC4854052.1 hypothetical protein [Jaaginema sp. PMC 1079.18]MEC4868608.1 hypothetical protein [Jaaginema sp. PMC 1078.18]
MSKFHHIMAQSAAWLVLMGRGLRWLSPFAGGISGRFATMGLMGIVGCAIAPSVVQAETVRVAIPIVRENDETYQNLLTRAENIARAATQRSFDQSILNTHAIVTILGQNNGAVVPVLKLEVNRGDWQAFPDPQRWAKYYTNANLLLGIEDSPSPTPTIAPPAPEPLPDLQPDLPEVLPDLETDDPILPGLPAPFPSLPALPPLP